MVESSVGPDHVESTFEAEAAPSTAREWVKPQVTRLELETAQATA
ncbi:hypothetical protein [Sphingosinicella sp. BN140058]|nr:hypothetical protein [Sphingosinicella sp. BN140058]